MNSNDSIKSKASSATKSNRAKRLKTADDKDLSIPRLRDKKGESHLKNKRDKLLKKEEKKGTKLVLKRNNGDFSK